MPSHTAVAPLAGSFCTAACNCVLSTVIFCCSVTDWVNQRMEASSTKPSIRSMKVCPAWMAPAFPEPDIEPDASKTSATEMAQRMVGSGQYSEKSLTSWPFSKTRNCEGS